MTTIFNSPFEMELRVLLLLAAAPDEPLSSDRIVAVDFVTVYGRDFNISAKSLHADNRFKFSEIASRRALVSIAIKNLVLNGFASVDLKEGYRYKITASGKNYADSLSSAYAVEYRELVEIAFEYCEDKSEQELLREFQRRALTENQEGM